MNKQDLINLTTGMNEETKESFLQNMTLNARKGVIMPVEFMPKHLTFVSDSQDVKFLCEYFGHIASGYESFFVEVGEGDYLQVWGMMGIVPSFDKYVTKVF